jgi:hypothetical protein
MNSNRQARNPVVFTAIYDGEKDAFRLSSADGPNPKKFERKPDRGSDHPVKAIKIEIH